jgi:hypothetical protein
VLVRAEGPADAIANALSVLPGVGALETAADGIIATPRSERVDPRPEIAAAVVQNGWKLIELRQLAVNLEEIFLEVTRRGEPAEAVEAAPAPETAETEGN